MRSGYILIFLTLVLLVVPSISIIVTADSGGTHYPLPNGIQKGDIVLIRWAHNISLFYSGLTYHHSMLYIGKINGVPRVIDADVPDDDPEGSVLNETWDDAMDRIYEHHGGYEKMVVVRVVPDPDHPYMIRDARKQFAEKKVDLPYDFDSQYVPRKQVQPTPESWWDDALPPDGVTGSTWIWKYCFSHPKNLADRYYCNELVWAAYFDASEGNRYLEESPDLGAIRGWEIEHAGSQQVQLISGTPSGGPLAHDNE